MYEIVWYDVFAYVMSRDINNEYVTAYALKHFVVIIFLFLTWNIETKSNNLGF